MNDAKKKILARRAQFIAAALAGLAASCGKEGSPRPCLEPMYSPGPDAGPPEPPPQPCLSPVAPEPADAGSRKP